MDTPNPTVPDVAGRDLTGPSELQRLTDAARASEDAGSLELLDLITRLEMGDPAAVAPALIELLEFVRECRPALEQLGSLSEQFAKGGLMSLLRKG